LATSAKSIFTPGIGMPSTFRLRFTVVLPSKTPPAMPIAPVTAGIATWVIVSRAEDWSPMPPLLGADFAALLRLSFAVLAGELRPVAALLAEERGFALALERLRVDPLDPLDDERPRGEARFDDPR
jgi:hypothetical protein